MDAKEVELRGKAITKAMNANEPSSSLINLLTDLRNNLKPTEELLRQTKIGVQVNRLRTHKDPSVAKVAGELVSRWRDEVNKQKRKGAPGKVAQASNGSASPAPTPASGTASPAPSKKKHDVDPASRSHKTDKVDLKITGDDSRDACIRLMYDGLAFMSEDLPEDIIVVAKAVESAAFANAGGMNTDYRTKMRSLFQNFKNKSNDDLRKRVRSGDIAPKRLVVMSHEELKSADRRKEDERLQKENMNEAMVAQVEKSISKDFQCGRCKKRMVSYSQAQTRSADEPMTTFCECTNCGHRWKFS
ncbi:transcription elongation factor-like protein s-ii [Aaosphaeria arxii CBS 175.79]|uniref:Transcription elongation factor n=1 Tax=Aaosphaeria arxii CBS 175.79 TaxID=1450172 RepID=A0A6A5XK32_9PLEO|nr:transcription elongation factor-like protein s-ii [Aaosphaeria arxii CBS 175.79]KAF2013313.1 transcription elongation factor-like protein s-ii [Aaosphaeria arxii CBS 175.79]